MNPGLPQGFVRFGTVPHRILVFALEFGRITHTMVEQELGIERREIGINIHRLRKFGFLVRIGRVDGYKTGCRTQGVHVLWGPDIKPLKSFRNKTAAERTRKMRAKKAVKVPSVFQFRGVINVQDSDLGRTTR